MLGERWAWGKGRAGCGAQSRACNNQRLDWDCVCVNTLAHLPTSELRIREMSLDRQQEPHLCKNQEKPC